MARTAIALARPSFGVPGRDWIEYQNDTPARKIAQGEALQKCLPHGHWNTSTLVLALRVDRACAPCILEGSLTGNAFVAYLTQFLSHEISAGDLVICDNLSCHKVDGVKEAIEACGAKLMYLPAYSPDVNPIEIAFSKLKAVMRKAEARRIEELPVPLNSSPKSAQNFSRMHNMRQTK